MQFIVTINSKTEDIYDAAVECEEIFSKLSVEDFCEAIDGNIVPLVGEGGALAPLRGTLAIVNGMKLITVRGK